MSNIMSFRDLLVWQKAMTLAVDCHRVAKKFPRDEQAVLGHQVRKSAVSLPSNIAEGFSRHSTAYYIQHLWMAHASGGELETQVEIRSADPDRRRCRGGTADIERSRNRAHAEWVGELARTRSIEQLIRKRLIPNTALSPEP